jgi:prepilin-type N-terminal cleavage/methylation domain-containing protein
MNSYARGFTLIELSIVLVIIGLIVGGVLVGQDMIAAAEVRATISQIEKYQTATNTFRGKYGDLPGDIRANSATTFGLAARGIYAGEGDGNGQIEGVNGNVAAHNTGVFQAAGETAMFWVDLSSAVTGNLIDGSFSAASSTAMPGADITGANINLYLPQAKIGRGNYIYVYNGAYHSASWTSTGINYFGLSAVTNIAASSSNGTIASSHNIPVEQAYAIDAKIDDGLPQSGNVLAWYLNGYEFWIDGTPTWNVPNQPVPYAGALAGSATTCYDNSNVAAATTHYSLGQHNGTGTNCALSFKFQ